MNTAIASALWIRLKEFDNDDLAALNNTLHGFGYVAKGNRCFKRAFEEKLIDENGKPFEFEELREVTSREVNKRVEAGNVQLSPHLKPKDRKMNNWSELKAAIEGKQVVAVERASESDSADGEVYGFSLVLADGVKVTFEADGAYDAIWIHYEIDGAK